MGTADLHARRGVLRSGDVLARRLGLSLVVAQAVGVATLLRSIAYDRWITVLASLFLIGGALAAQRGRTWGIGMSFAAAVAFPVAFAIGIAPPWFCLVGLAGMLPFALTWRPLARFDKGAATVLAAIAVAGGAGAAMAWKEMAWDVFTAFPSLIPSRYAHHDVALLATIAVTVGLVAGWRRTVRDASEPSGAASLTGVRYRIDESESVTSAALDETTQHHDDLFDHERLEIENDDALKRRRLPR